MSTLKSNNVQVGQSVTATNNFTLYQPATPDGTIRLGVGNAGATTSDVISADSSGNFKFNSGYGSATTAYGCRAWVNFNGSANTNLNGTYSQSGTTVTVTATAHGLIVGSLIYADITTGTGVDGVYTVATVINSNSFTYTAGTSLTTSGNITLIRSTIRASGGVSSVSDNGTGDYTVNTTAFVDANFAVVGTASGDTAACIVTITQGTDPLPTTTAIRFRTRTDGGTLADREYIGIAVFR